MQDASQAGRRLQQATPATDAHVRAKAGDAATANTARSQLQEAASNGKLVVSPQTLSEDFSQSQISLIASALLALPCLLEQPRCSLVCMGVDFSQHRV